MNKPLMYVATLALTTLLPNLTAAQSVATSLSVSFGDNDGTVNFGDDGLPTGINGPTSLSFATASGTYAVASSVANQNSTGALAGASDGSEFTPIGEIAFNAQTNAYETNVMFPTGGTNDDGAQTGFNLCIDGFLTGANGQNLQNQSCAQ